MVKKAILGIDSPKKKLKFSNKIKERKKKKPAKYRLAVRYPLFKKRIAKGKIKPIKAIEGNNNFIRMRKNLNIKKV